VSDYAEIWYIEAAEARNCNVNIHFRWNPRNLLAAQGDTI